MLIAQNASQLYGIAGDFARPVGPVQKEENGYIFLGEEYEIRTVVTPHSSGVLRREDTFINNSERPLTLYSALSRFTYAGADFEVYTQRTEWTEESLGAWQSLHTAICAENDDLRLNCGASPFMALFNTQKREGRAYHVLADSLWQVKAARHFVVDEHAAEVVVELGISPRAFRYTVAPGESFSLAPILYYTFKSKQDMDAYKLHRYANDLYPQKRMPVIYNTWMYRFGKLNFDDLLVQLDKAKELGAEYFVLDAGWFGRGWNTHSGFGTWLEETDKALCGRMKELFARVREAGLKPGVWFEIEGAATVSSVYEENKEKYFLEKGRAFVDFASPEGVSHILSLLSERISRYGIEFIKFDYNVVPDICPQSDSFVSYFKGYRSFIRGLRALHPDLYIECCAGGGLRMAMTNVGDFDSFWLSDNHSLRAQLDIYKNTLIRMPSRALEHWVTVEGVEHFRENFAGEEAPLLYSCGNATWSAEESIKEEFLLSAMLGGPIGLSCDLSAIPEGAFQKLKETIASFKEERAFWQTSECRILADDSRVLVLQFSDEALKTVKIFAFGKCKHQKTVTVLPKVADGLTYRDQSGALLSSSEIREDGLTLPLDGEGSASTLCLQMQA